MTNPIYVKKSFNITPRADEAAQELRASMDFTLTESINKGLVLLNTLAKYQDAGGKIIVKQCDGKEEIIHIVI